MNLFKKGITPVVATTLLLVITVLSIVGFQGWFGTYSSSMFSDVEITSNSASSNDLKIDTLIGDNLYVINNVEDNLSINSLEIGDVECLLNDNLTLGMNNLDVSDCVGSIITSTPDVVLITDNGILEKKFYLSEINSGGVVVLNSYFNEVLSDNPVAYWRMDEGTAGSGTPLIDSSGNSHDGTLYALNVNQTGALISDSSSYSVEFISSMSAVMFNAEIPDHIDFNITNDLTVEGWIKFTSIFYESPILTNRVRGYSATPEHGPFSLYINETDNKVYFLVSNSTVDYLIKSINPYNDGNWHHIVGVKNLNNLNLYIDGSLVASRSDFIGLIDTNSSNLRIADYIDTDRHNAYNGFFDEIAIYDSALSLTRIQEHYNFAIS